MIRPPAVELPLTQGAFTKYGLLTSDSKGALGAPDIRIYTPLSEGSDGTVMMSTKKNVHLERGTRILIVIQPPRVEASSNCLEHESKTGFYSSSVLVSDSLIST